MSASRPSLRRYFVSGLLTLYLIAMGFRESWGHGVAWLIVLVPAAALIYLGRQRPAQAGHLPLAPRQAVEARFAEMRVDALFEQGGADLLHHRLALGDARHDGHVAGQHRGQPAPHLLLVEAAQAIGAVHVLRLHGDAVGFEQRSAGRQREGRRLRPCPSSTPTS